MSDENLCSDGGLGIVTASFFAKNSAYFEYIISN